MLGFGGGEVERLAEVVGVALAVLDQLVDYAPVREAAHLTIVDKEVRLELAAADGRAVHLLVGVVAVHGEKLHASLTAKLDRFVQQFSLAHRPKNQAVSVALEHLQRRGGKGNLLADRGVFVLDNRTVEINCYGHLENLFCVFLWLDHRSRGGCFRCDAMLFVGVWPQFRGFVIR